MAHAKLSPSGASRWAICPASVKMSELYENKTNEAAEWGTKTHELGEKMLLKEAINFDDYDENQIELAKDYVEYCESLLGKNSILLAEECYNLNFIAENTFGTCDCTILDDKGTLHIIDLKTGFHKVEAKENMQLMLYGLGAYYDLDAIFEIKSIKLHIVQTKIGFIDDWELSIEDLFTFEKWITERAKEALSDNPSFNPEKKACLWCPHKVNCEALATHVEKVIKGEFEKYEDVKENKPMSERVKEILDNADLIISFIELIKMDAVERLKRGEVVDGYKLVEARTNRKWNNVEEVEGYLKSLDNGVNYYKAPELLPMGEILKKIGKNTEIESYIIKPKGGVVLAPISDKRPAFNGCDEFEEI